MLITAFVSAQNSKVARSTTGSSSIESASNSFQMKGTLGQIAVGVSAGSEATIASGYWGWITRNTSLNTEKRRLFHLYSRFNPRTQIRLILLQELICKYQMLGKWK